MAMGTTATIRILTRAMVVLALFPVLVFAVSYPSKPAGFVLDEANALGDVTTLEQRLAAYEEQTSNEIYVVTIRSLEGLNVENYATALFNTWAIGKAELDNGILLLVARSERKVRIEVGDGLTGALTDREASRILDRDVLPRFKRQDVRGGIEAALAAITAELGGPSLFNAPPTPEGDLTARERAFDWSPIAVGVGMVVLILALSAGKAFLQWRRLPMQAPPGTIPPATPPPQYPGGPYPPGAYPPGSYPPGAYPPGAYPPEVYPPGAQPFVRPSFWQYWGRTYRQRGTRRTSFRSSGRRGGGRSSGRGASGSW